MREGGEVHPQSREASPLLSGGQTLADEIAQGLTHYVPGEHDVIDEGLGKAYLDRYGKGTKGQGWYSFDDHGVHFIGLVNVVDLKAGGLGRLGADQLAWLADCLLYTSPSPRD